MRIFKRRLPDPNHNLARSKVEQARSESRRTDAIERASMLHEWELLRSISPVGRTEAQKLRFEELYEALWPEREPNPIVGIRRVKGGHGFPVSADIQAMGQTRTSSAVEQALDDALEEALAASEGKDCYGSLDA